MNRIYLNKNFLPYSLLVKKEEKNNIMKKRLVLLFTILVIALFPFAVESLQNKEKDLKEVKIEKTEEYHDILNITNVLDLIKYCEVGEITKGESYLITKGEENIHYFYENTTVKVISVENLGESMYKIRLKVE